ncbi:MAG: sigma-E processing peptidase SpoIIGA [Oscillospiraceae bacterium]|nr:sigma-E processing peptidase SpoIIGA [Oscillospiraceae bacterium]
MDTIYIDVLIVLNIYVNYFLLKATAKLTHNTPETAGIVISSVMGSLFSLVILIPFSNFLLIFIIKAASAFLIVMAAFRKKSMKEYVRITVYFYIINFLFAGIIMGLRGFLKADYISVNNSFIYVDVSLISLVVFTAAAYFIVCGIRMITDRCTVNCGKYSVLIRNGDRVVSVEGLSDTGNAMTDVFSGRPVIVCSAEILNELTGTDYLSGEIYDFLMNSSKMHGVRLVPYSTIDGTGMLPAFRPDEVIIRGENTVRTVDALVGIKETGGRAVFNPSILV